MYVASQSGSYELSTEYSIDTEEEHKNNNNAYDYYRRYAWLKEKLWDNY